MKSIESVDFIPEIEEKKSFRIKFPCGWWREEEEIEQNFEVSFTFLSDLSSGCLPEFALGQPSQWQSPFYTNYRILIIFQSSILFLEAPLSCTRPTGHPTGWHPSPNWIIIRWDRRRLTPGWVAIIFEILSQSCSSQTGQIQTDSKWDEDCICFKCSPW